MKRLFNLFFSPKVTVFLLLVFSIAIGTATFIEDRFDTNTAKVFVYNAVWFEIVILLLGLNFIGNIKRYHLFSLKKMPVFIFHIAFVLIIAGAGITRYNGFEGSMHIRQGQSANLIYGSDPWLFVATDNGSRNVIFEKKLVLSEALNNTFETDIKINESQTFHLKCKDYYRNAIDRITENLPDGEDIIEISVSTENGLENFHLKSGKQLKISSLNVSFNLNDAKEGIQIFETDGKLWIKSPSGMIQTNRMRTITDSIAKDSVAEFKVGLVYQSAAGVFLFNKFFKKAKKQVVRASDQEKGMEALFFDVTFDGKTEEFIVFGGKGYPAEFINLNLNGADLKFAFGDKSVSLPFSLQLNEFILKRYPGSSMPSSFESRVTLIDARKNLNQEHRIFMNHILDYDGYRFFQSSYDSDEMGTILSVNHDFAGTFVSYTGYILLGIGFILTMLGKNTRFRIIMNKIEEIRIKRKTLLTVCIILLFFPALLQAQTSSQQKIDPEHAEKFGHLLIQTFDGRFEPVHTLAIDVLRKLSKKDKFTIEGKGSFSAMQVFLDMQLNREYWKTQKIILVREKTVRDLIGLEEKYASFNDFFDEKGNYKLVSYSERAFQKKQSEESAFDKEVIKVDERVNILFSILSGNMLNLFPELDSPNNKWVNWTDSAANVLITGPMKVINQDLQLKNFNYSNILQHYFDAVNQAITTGDYSMANKTLKYIEDIQRQNSTEGIIPSRLQVNLEIQYNNSNIFTVLRNIYAVLCIILLILAFLDTLQSKRNKIVRGLLLTFIVLTGVAFLGHTYGLGLRWYLTGHAPWSNGYEALLLVAWGGLFAGFLFIRSSKITFAATVLLAFCMLLTAGHSSYDPQLTNLQPVLKSYWLIIHVASITIGYGFLGVGFFLGIISLGIIIAGNQLNSIKTNLLINELTLINEVNLSIGLFLATIGTFLGAVWANESWGRYWGWDAKETWALVIIMVYSIVLHFRLIPKLKHPFFFNAASVLAFSSVIMTFIGVNYYLSKGLHSYGAGDTPVFPVWAWVLILAIIALIIIAGKKSSVFKKANNTENAINE
jgi:cytochrome c-type biogenesis protein CcsB